MFIPTVPPPFSETHNNSKTQNSDSQSSDVSKQYFFVILECSVRAYLPQLQHGALDILRPPFTRPSAVMAPPAASTRRRSTSSSGLWSIDKSSALPLRHKTQRLSPALAT
uniref:Uncharacterized protein n=1 Tax=Romanomermis culicivorax TaxID=13658 RepID=A0A915KEQ3_ROMCU